MNETEIILNEYFDFFDSRRNCDTISYVDLRAGLCTVEESISAEVITLTFGSILHNDREPRWSCYHGERDTIFPLKTCQETGESSKKT